MLQIEDRGAVRYLRLDRPEVRNALDLALLRALRVALGQARAEAVRCLVITGNGKSFCAGADVAEWAEADAQGDAKDHPWMAECHGLIAELAEFPAPTVAWLNGAAVGAGLDLALACDFRLAADTAKFQCAYTRMAYSPDAGGTWLMPRLIGLDQAKRFVFTGEFWSAVEALSRGLITEAHSLEQLAAAVDGFAARLAAGPTVALSQAKRLMQDASRRTLREQLAAELAAGKICADSADAKEAMAAAVERRTPSFRGR